MRLGLHVLKRQHLNQVFAHGFGGHRPQVELQAARQHGGGHFLRIGRGQHELEVVGRLLQRLEHGVERRVRQHVNLVDHEDLEAAHDRLVHRLFEQLGDFIDAPVGRGVELGVVHKAATVDVPAGLANPAGLGGDAALPVKAGAVERLGQDAGNGGFAHAARAGEQISMVQTPGAQRIAQRLHHVRLADHFRKILGAVFAGEH